MTRKSMVKLTPEKIGSERKQQKTKKRGKENFHGPGTSTAKFYPAANK